MIRTLTLFVVGLLLASPLHADLTININAGSALAGNAGALAAFNRAAASWEAIFTDDIVINIDANLGTFGNPNIIGSASSVVLASDHDEIVNAMKADALGDNDAIAAFLPSAAQVLWTTPSGVSTNGNLSANKATLKALGFTGLDAQFGATDATITFNSAFNFDYDNSDGVGAGLTDFETVAAHEIGHALGFTSAVDSIDVGASTVPPRVLDLFRFETAAAPTTDSEFTSVARSLSPGVNSAFSDTENLWRFSTGQFNGDGRQASHWKADEITGVHIGLMDPTLSAGVAFGISDADIRALDLIGFDFNPVPEPSAMLLLGSAVAVVASRRRRRLG